MPSPESPVSRRRLLLSVAGMTLISACGTDKKHLSSRLSGSRPATGNSSSSPPPSLTPTSSASLSPSPSSSASEEPVPADRPGQPQHYVHDGPKAVALTIDDGPDPRFTPLVLDLLHSLGITAGFCLIGRSAQAHPELVREVHDHGHVLVNHTWTHADLSALRPGAVQDEIRRAEDAIGTASGGFRPTLFRAPYGAWSAATLNTCAQMSLRPLAWSVDPRDWSRPGVPHIVETVMGTTRPGSIILEHDGGGDRSQTVAALHIFLPRLLEQGYHFVTP